MSLGSALTALALVLGTAGGAAAGATLETPPGAATAGGAQWGSSGADLQTGRSTAPDRGGRDTVPTPATGVNDSHAPAGPTWSWPLRPRPDVVTGFAPPDQRWEAGHRGVDLLARVGQTVLAPAAGRVGFAGVIAGRGVIVVVHAAGLRSTFEPVTGTAPVGSPVAAGDPVGTVTSTPGHCAPTTCLHWGVLRGETYLDPLALLSRRPIVLLPLA